MITQYKCVCCASSLRSARYNGWENTKWYRDLGLFIWQGQLFLSRYEIQIENNMTYDETGHRKYYHEAQKVFQICLPLHLIENPTFPLNAFIAIKCQYELFIWDSRALWLCKGDLQPYLLKCLNSPWQNWINNDIHDYKMPWVTSYSLSVYQYKPKIYSKAFRLTKAAFMWSNSAVIRVVLWQIVPV